MIHLPCLQHIDIFEGNSFPLLLDILPDLHAVATEHMFGTIFGNKHVVKALKSTNAKMDNVRVSDIDQVMNQ